jgi:hypothetical protein
MAHFCVGGTDGTFLVVSGDYVDLTEDETIVCVCVWVCLWVGECVCVCGCVSMGESVGVYAFVCGGVFVGVFVFSQITGLQTFLYLNSKIQQRLVPP